MTRPIATTPKTSALEEAIKRKDKKAIRLYQRLLALAINKEKQAKAKNIYR